MRLTEQQRLEKEREAASLLQKQQEELARNQARTQETEEKAGNMRSTYNADRRVLQEKIDDLERKLTQRAGEIQSLQQKLHMMVQAEGS